ncbi:DUF4365 domain-containing protein [Curtobacterium sp. Arg-1]|uniref:DUF4365 domain-containing protein n=2 Tax=Curtobacterium TaxID=2034 RepID=UPI00188D3D51|nr:DUF4365 domain-containing protein [Curtobacterium sp. VKM Ac-1796]
MPSSAPIGAPTPALALRGSPSRHTDWMEQFQVAYVRAIAAAAGCAIVGEPNVDDGVDVVLSHRSTAHKHSGAVYLELQLKATSSPVLAGTRRVSATMRSDRYAEHLDATPNMDRIVVLMSMPADPADWITASHANLLVRHCAYWVNLAGGPASSAARPTVSASVHNIFDDVTLCNIMARIGQGGKP